MEDLKEIKLLLQSNVTALKRLETAILGDEQANIKGLAAQMKEHEIIIKDYIDNKNRFIGIKQVVTLIGAGIVAFLTAFFAPHK